MSTEQYMELLKAAHELYLKLVSVELQLKPSTVQPKQEKYYLLIEEHPDEIYETRYSLHLSIERAMRRAEYHAMVLFEGQMEDREMRQYDWVGMRLAIRNIKWTIKPIEVEP